MFDRLTSAMERFERRTCFTDVYSLSDRVLGTGVSGDILECFDKTGHRFAVKKLVNDKKSRKEVSFHCAAAAGENIVNVVDIFNDKDHIWLVMELMEGGEFFTQLKKRRKFPEEEAAVIMKEMCLALQYLHDKNITHRDLKPENFLFKKINEKWCLKLTDFGFAEVARSPKASRSMCYTPYYAAPEVFKEERYFDKPCDIWSLGVIFYITLSGSPPFYSQNNTGMSPGMRRKIMKGQYRFPEEIFKDVSQEAKDLIKGCLEIDAEKRLTVDEVLDSRWMKRFDSLPTTITVEPKYHPNIPVVVERKEDTMEEKTSYEEREASLDSIEGYVENNKMKKPAPLKKYWTKLVRHFQTANTDLAHYIKNYDGI